jgi:hypothetical protein
VRGVGLEPALPCPTTGLGTPKQICNLQFCSIFKLIFGNIYFNWFVELPERMQGFIISYDVCRAFDLRYNIFGLSNTSGMFIFKSATLQLTGIREQTAIYSYWVS